MKRSRRRLLEAEAPEARSVARRIIACLKQRIQGEVIKVTVPGKTVTTPDAGTVLSPFRFVVINQSTGTITIAGNATNNQTVDGSTTQVIKAGSGCFVFTDGTNWFTSGLKPAQLERLYANQTGGNGDQS